MKRVILALVLICSYVTASAQVNWTLDAGHTSVQFSVEHMGFSETTGNFKKVEGTFQSSDEQVSTLSGTVTIQVASINTDDDGRDKHLRSADFLDAEKFPTMTFAIKSMKKSGKNITVNGDLTLKGVTKPVVLTGTFKGTGKDPYGNTRAGFARLSTKINRQDFGVSFNGKLAAGGLVVGNEVEITINAELIKK